MADEILEVDLLAFEQGSAEQQRAVVDGLMRSLATGFVYVTHDISADLIDEAYALLEQFFSLPAETKAQFVAPGTHGQTGYTGLLVETAASADVADWKEMLNWARDVPPAHPLRTRFPHRYHDQVLPEAAVPGISAVLNAFSQIADSLATPGADRDNLFGTLPSLGVAPETLGHLDRVLAQFEDYCTVSQSVKTGIPYTVTVKAPDGRVVKAA